MRAHGHARGPGRARALAVARAIALWGALIVVTALTARAARATAPPSDDATFRFRSAGLLTVDGGLVLGLPVALGTGLSTGVAGGVSIGRLWAWGVRASWSTATESSSIWTVTHADVQLRATGAVQHAAGRGRFALRLGLGPTLVHETRVRDQGQRAGLTGSALEASAWVALPTADLNVVVAVHVAGPWLLTLSGGPSFTIIDGAARAGWTAQLGAGWQP